MPEHIHVYLCPPVPVPVSTCVSVYSCVHACIPFGSNCHSTYLWKWSCKAPLAVVPLPGPGIEDRTPPNPVYPPDVPHSERGRAGPGPGNCSAQCGVSAERSNYRDKNAPRKSRRDLLISDPQVTTVRQSVNKGRRAPVIPTNPS